MKKVIGNINELTNNYTSGDLGFKLYDKYGYPRAEEQIIVSVSVSGDFEVNLTTTEETKRLGHFYKLTLLDENETLPYKIWIDGIIENQDIKTTFFKKPEMRMFYTIDENTLAIKPNLEFVKQLNEFFAGETDFTNTAFKNFIETYAAVYDVETISNFVTVLDEFIGKVIDKLNDVYFDEYNTNTDEQNKALVEKIIIELLKEV